jgi:hypothetical protein
VGPTNEFSYDIIEKLADYQSYSFKKSISFVKILRCEHNVLNLRSDF